MPLSHLEHACFNFFQLVMQRKVKDIGFWITGINPTDNCPYLFNGLFGGIGNERMRGGMNKGNIKCEWINHQAKLQKKSTLKAAKGSVYSWNKAKRRQELFKKKSFFWEVNRKVSMRSFYVKWYWLYILPKNSSLLSTY